MQTNDLLITLSPEDRQALEDAYRHLEHPSLAARLTNVVGTPIEIGLHLLPKNWYDKLHTGVERAITKALDMAISSLHPHYPSMAHEHFYKVLGASTGAVGGVFGLAGLIVELPITTAIMLRAIADIAHSQGESMGSLDTRLACMQVFALGGRSEEDDASDTGYYGVRLALALSVSNAVEHIAEKGINKKSGPALVNLLTRISSRFGVVVSERAAAQIIPIVGAAGAALINTIFIHHFQDMARGHFTIRRLERKYGPDLVEAAYTSLSSPPVHG
jgi:hypothetical protein